MTQADKIAAAARRDIAEYERERAAMLRHYERRSFGQMVAAGTAILAIAILALIVVGAL